MTREVTSSDYIKKIASAAYPALAILAKGQLKELLKTTKRNLAQK